MFWWVSFWKVRVLWSAGGECLCCCDAKNSMGIKTSMKTTQRSRTEQVRHPSQYVSWKVRSHKEHCKLHTRHSLVGGEVEKLVDLANTRRSAMALSQAVCGVEELMDRG